MARLLGFVTCTILFWISAAAQFTVTLEEGALTDLSRGYAYTLDPDPSAQNPVLPVINGGEAANPVIITIHGVPGARFRVEFILPSVLVGDLLGTAACTFPANALYVENTSSRRDPNGAVWVTTGIDSNATLDLGIAVGVPADAAGGDTYRGSLSCIVSDSSGASVSRGTVFSAVVFDYEIEIWPDEGYMEGLLSGYTFTLNPDPDGSPPVTPVISEEEDGYPATFGIAGPAGARVRVAFKLPSQLIGESPGALPCSFPGNFVFVEETGERWDPRSPHVVTLGTSETVTLHLGWRVAIPEGAVPDEEYAGTVVCVAGDSGSSTSAAARILVYPRAPGIELVDEPGTIESLSPGYTYTLTPGLNTPENITPIVNGRESGVAAGFRLAGTPGASVTVEFILPTDLIGTGTSMMPCSFLPNSVFLEETGERWDPHQPRAITLGSGAETTFRLGITVTVPPDAGIQVFHGNVRCRALSANETYSADAQFTVAVWDPASAPPDSAWVSFEPDQADVALISMRATNAALDQRTVAFGFAPGMNDCINPQDNMLTFAEYLFPPIPPTDVMDVRMVDPISPTRPCFDLGSPADFRTPPGPGTQDTFRISCQPGAGGYPVRLEWSRLLTGSFAGLWLVDAITYGALFNVDMLASTVFDLTPPHTGFVVIGRRAGVPVESWVPGVRAVLHCNRCDSVRITELAFGWDSVSWPVIPLNWGASTNQDRVLIAGLNDQAPLLPQRASFIYRSFPGGGADSLFLPALVPGRRYRLRTLCDVSAAQEPSPVPDSWLLAQNYPNPFNPATTIRVAIPSGPSAAVQKVSLEVFDLLGNNVATLWDGPMDPGVHTIRFDAAGLSSGVYLYRLNAGPFVSVRKMVLLR